MLIATDGNFYGTTYTGGPEAGDEGAIYRLGPAVPGFAYVPVNLTIATGSTNIYSVTVSSIYDTSCQWQFDRTNLVDGGNISGSTSSTLTIAPATLANTGTYTLIASNVAGVNTASAVLTVLPAVFLTQPADMTILAGESNAFGASVESILPASFQWQFDGTNLSDGGNISGATTTNLIIAGATLADTGTYSLVVSNSAGSVLSDGAVLIVESLFVSSPPSDLTLLAGAMGTFTEDIESDLPASYQWQLDGANLTDGLDFSGTETSNLTVTATTADAGTYTVVAANADGSVTNSATLSVTPFIVTTPPASAMALTGSSISFALGIQSVYPMTYQWGFNGSSLSDNDHITGSSTATLNIVDIGPTDAGTYAVTAGNAAGSTNFSVILTVITPFAPGTSLSNLYSFTGGNDGANPKAALLQTNGGNLYGTTYAGGVYGNGAIFQLSPAGSLTTIYSLGADTSGIDGSGPVAALVAGSETNFYGTTEFGGLDGYGTVFEVTPAGSFTNLDSFSFAYGLPLGALVPDTNGCFYGATLQSDFFQMASNGALTNLYGTTPEQTGFSATLLLATDGNFYGVSANGGTNGLGYICRLTTTGTFTALYTFTGAADGSQPCAPLIQGNDGALYGSTAYGAKGFGTVFRLTTNGAFSVVYTFGTLTNWDGSAQDGTQANGLLLGNDGNFYGTTLLGGYNENGTIFRLTSGGELNTMVFFDGTNGARPEAALVQGSDGYYYGTASAGGSNNAGTIFKISVPPCFNAATQSNGMFSFSSSALVGQSYQVQYTSSLASSNWQNLGSPIQPTTPTLTITEAIGPTQRFYRIVLLPSQ